MYYNSQGGKFAMYIALPTKIDGLDELVSNIDISAIRTMQFTRQFTKTQIKVSLPKFKILHTTKLNDILKSVNIFYEFCAKNSFNSYCYHFNLV